MGRKIPNLEIKIIIPTDDSIKDSNNHGTVDTRQCDSLCDKGCDLMNSVGSLGAGIAATVSKVITNDGRFLAKKVLNIKTSVSNFQKYKKDIETIKKCDSKYVIKTYGACYSQRYITLFLEHMDIGSLDVVLYKLNRVPERVLSPITRHVVKGLDYLRGIGIIHKDVKPANILLNSLGDIKLCDFGIDTDDEYYGTIAYMSAERLSAEVNCNSLEEGEKADIWSLGVTVFQLAIGDYPFPSIASEEEFDRWFSLDSYGVQPRFKGRTQMKDIPKVDTLSMLQILNDTVPELPSRFFNPEIRSFLDICLSKNPIDRSSYKELNKHPFLNLDIRSKMTIEEGECFNWLNVIKFYKDPESGKGSESLPRSSNKG